MVKAKQSLNTDTQLQTSKQNTFNFPKQETPGIACTSAVVNWYLKKWQKCDKQYKYK